MKSIDYLSSRKMNLPYHLNCLSLILVSLIHALNNALQTETYEAHHYNLPIYHCDKISKVSLFLAAVSVVIFGISRRHGQFLMGVLSLILSLGMDTDDHDSESHCQNTLAQIPWSMDTMLLCFKLDTKTTSYAVCPACNCTYKLRAGLSSSHTQYPMNCTNRPIPEDGPCGELLLWHSTDRQLELIKTFLYHHFHDYLAGLLSRPDLKALMDKPCNDLLASIGSLPCIMSDVWDVSFFALLAVLWDSPCSLTGEMRADMHLRSTLISLSSKAICSKMHQHLLASYLVLV